MKVTILAVSISVILTVVIVVIISSLVKKGMYKYPDELLDPIPIFNTTNYKLDISKDITFGETYSPIYTCSADLIPNQIVEFAKELGLTRYDSEYIVNWADSEGIEILRFEINTQYLYIDLNSQTQLIKFDGIDSFVNDVLGFDFQYVTPLVVDIDGTKMYMTKRIVDSKELYTQEAYSDYFEVEEGYLIGAKFLVANIEKSKYVVPLISDSMELKKYVGLEKYPRYLSVDLSEISRDPELSYEEQAFVQYSGDCIVDDIEEILFYSSCSNNYIYSAYRVGGICEIQNTATTFTGFINAIEPDYVKSF